MVCKCRVWRGVGLVVYFGRFFVHWYFEWEYYDWVDHYLGGRFCGYADVVVIDVSQRPLNDVVYYDVALYAVDIDISVEMACVSVF